MIIRVQNTLAHILKHTIQLMVGRVGPAIVISYVARYGKNLIQIHCNSCYRYYNVTVYSIIPVQYALVDIYAAW